TSIAEGNQTNAPNFSPSANSDSQSYSLDQVNSISQFSDVSQQDWAFEALRNLVENYGCLVGYPDGTYRGERPLTRYEFAAGLNACLQQVERQGTRPAATAETPAGSYQSQDSLADVFNRAFFNSTGQFFDQVNLSGQFNAMFGWRSFPQGSFRENQITDDAETLSVLMRDVLKQQSNGTPPLRTRDLANPFDTSLRDNPSYLSPAEQRSANREVIINIEQKPLSP
ncbi:MAG: iron uptake porin, partial [Microcystaceae cyanobacterium]